MGVLACEKQKAKKKKKKKKNTGERSVKPLLLVSGNLREEGGVRGTREGVHDVEGGEDEAEVDGIFRGGLGKVRGKEEGPKGNA